MDEADKAQISEQEHLELAMARMVRYEGESADDCIECGELIPSARQIAVPGCQMCVECASIAEVRR